MAMELFSQVIGQQRIESDVSPQYFFNTPWQWLSAKSRSPPLFQSRLEDQVQTDRYRHRDYDQKDYKFFHLTSTPAVRHHWYGANDPQQTIYAIGRRTDALRCRSQAAPGGRDKALQTLVWARVES